jgi:hypothetical protein
MSQCERCADLERELADEKDDGKTWAAHVKVLETDAKRMREREGRLRAQRDAAMERLREVGGRLYGRGEFRLNEDIASTARSVLGQFGPTLTDNLEGSPATPATDESTSTDDRSKRDSPRP